jgi:hypothetical protein
MPELPVAFDLLHREIASTKQVPRPARKFPAFTMTIDLRPKPPLFAPKPA